MAQCQGFSPGMVQSGGGMKPHWILFGLAGVVILAAPSFRASTANPAHHRKPQTPQKPVQSAQTDKAVALEIAQDHNNAPWDVHQQEQPAQATIIKESTAEASLLPVQTITPPVTVRPIASSLDIQRPTYRLSTSRASTIDTPQRLSTPPPVSNTALSQVIEQVRSTKRFVEEQFAALARDHEATQRELAARKQQVAALEKRLSAMAQQLAERDRRLRELETLRNTLQSELQENADHASEMQKQIDQLIRDKRNMPRQMGELQLRNEKLEEENRTLRNAKKEANEAQRQLDRLTKEVNQKNRTIERLTHELETNKSEMQEVADQLTNIQRARGELEEKHKENLSAMESVQAQVDGLTQALNNGENQINSLQDALAQRDLQLKQAEAIIQVIQQRGAATSRLTPPYQPATTSRIVPGSSKSHFDSYLHSRRQGIMDSSGARKKSSKSW